MLKGESHDAARLQEAVCLAPALSDQTLVEAVRIFRLAGLVRYSFQRLRRVLIAENVRILVLERQT